MLLVDFPEGVTLWLFCPQPGTVLIMKGHEELGRSQPASRVIHPPHPAPKVRYDVSARRTGPSAGNKATAGPEGEFPCKKCGRSVVRWTAARSFMQAGRRTPSVEC